ncbi:hypothetical protein J8C06_13360 [Chloracidobacterium validum]|uniref:Uncharacterized protein n=1 Tax=Chloracidobacterium validum TaxID=2821543 RepID=A0ABX8BG30_9BACT|nr:hypothetical protein [Chloracidobacterium validum]QUW04035.1 hypothetical protein J8C06_13360 [Chloracidobacterium validum]
MQPNPTPRRLANWSVSLLVGLCLIGGQPPRSVLSRTQPNHRLADFQLQPSEIETLHGGGIVSQALPTAQPKTIAAQALAILDTSPEAFLQAYRSLEVIRHGGSVIACGRFSPTPTPADVATLPVSDDLVTSLAGVRQSDAGVKLCAAEIEQLSRLRQADAPLVFRRQLAATYRQMLVERAQAYAAHGLAGLPAYADKKEPIDARRATTSLLAEQSRLRPGQAAVCAALRHFPNLDANRAESFLYWAVQKYGDLKPVTTLVHVVIWHDDGRDYVASSLVYANHYTEAALVVAELLPWADTNGQMRTLVAYSIRVQTDLLGGQLGFLKKKFAQAKLTSTVKGGLASLRTVVASSTVAQAPTR